MEYSSWIWVERGYIVTRIFGLAIILFIKNEALPSGILLTCSLFGRHCMQFAVIAGKGVKRETDYLLQQHLKLSKLFFLANWLRVMEHRMQIQSNRGRTQLFFGTLRKGLK